MSTVVDSPKRLFWLIILAVVAPWLAVALEFGWGGVFVKTFVLSFICPVALTLTGIPPLIIVGQVVSLLGFGYAVYQLVHRRYQPASQDETASDAEASNTELSSPPDYVSSEAPVETAGKR